MGSYDKINNPLLDDEDRAALERVHRATGRSWAVRHVREAGLKPWMRSFAAWFALEGNALTRKEQLIRCRQYAKDRVRLPTMIVLLNRPDFKELVNRYTDDGIAATREQLQGLLPKVVENVEWSIDKAREKEDYKAMAGVVEPVLARTIPKKDDTPARPPVLIVNLGSGFAKQYAEAEMQEPEVIELPLPNDDNETVAS